MNIRFRWNVFAGENAIHVNMPFNISPDYYFAIKKVLKVKKLTSHNYIRIGNLEQDGGYIMAHDFNQKDKIAYSFGIWNNVDWDDDMANRGYEIYMYDPTIEALPHERKEFHFFQVGLAGKNGGNLRTLDTHIQENKHENKQNMILKMDIEAWEWSFLETVSENTLNQFDQIIMELHDITGACTKETQLKRIAALEKLNKTHHLIHLHANNCGHILTIGNADIPDVMELTYVKKSKFEVVEDNDIEFPTEIDCINDKRRKDWILGKWNTPFIFEEREDL